jgi:hypothetical protein
MEYLSKEKSVKMSGTKLAYALAVCPRSSAQSLVPGSCRA